MCGFAGLWVPGAGLSQKALEAQAVQMAEAIIHRGPDSSGGWADERAGVALAHRRLSILDLSPHGHQPMQARAGQYILVYNGEIYNFREIRKDLEDKENVAFRGHSDTEVLLAALTRWGVEKTLAAAHGMFAFAFWDARGRRLTLARDRFGEKPLYYGNHNGGIVFASELKSLRALEGFEARLNQNALAQYLRCRYVASPHCIYDGVQKLPPGSFVTLTQQGDVVQASEPEFYWDMHALMREGEKAPLDLPDEALVDLLEETLKGAVAQQMVADVPLGAFLSGGIDSSAIVALMQAQSTRPVKTYTIGFGEAEYDESAHAAAVAKHLGTEHTMLRVTEADARAVIPRLPDMYDEPLADASALPTFLVCQMARQHVTVALSGDAGDELFAGYNRYIWGQKIWRKLGGFPMGVRRKMAQMLTVLPPSTWNSMGKMLGKNGLGRKLHKLAGVLDAESQDALYTRLMSFWPDPAALLIAPVQEPVGSVLNGEAYQDIHDPVSRMMQRDVDGFLPDDILVKTDRAAMAVSLETRVPLLDPNVAMLAARVPMHAKLRHGEGKWLLRQVLFRHVPRELIERPKAGFDLPIDHWLRGPLRDWAEGLLSESRLREEGIFHPMPIRDAWKQHLSGRYNHHDALWTILMFQAWKERWLL